MIRRTIPSSVLWVAAAAAVAGCAMLGMRGGAAPGFSHRLHSRDAGLPCSSCHAGAEGGARAGMPSLELCRGCHAEEDEAALPEEHHLDRILGDAPLTWGELPSRFPPDVVFSHAVHRAGGLDCEACHGDLASLDGPTDPLRIGKPTCLSCHEDSGVDDRCRTCHTEIDENWLPPNHAAGWMTLHGRVARSANPRSFDENCSACHEESTCVDCHLAEAPQDHTHFWKQRGHAIEARIDREKCATCHRSDSCDRCHSEVAPISHRGPWGDPLNVHCLTCHLGGTRECALCHDGTPSHALATPLPPGHLPTFNCRGCHGAGGAPLPHVDNGDECISCHF